jgi:hypothetical protein
MDAPVRRKSLLALALSVAAYLLTFIASQAELPESRAFALALGVILFALPVVAIVFAIWTILESRGRERGRANRTSVWAPWLAAGVLVLAVPLVGALGFYSVRRYVHNLGRRNTVTWTQFTSSAGDFTVSFPATPTESTETVQRPGGPVPFHVAAVAMSSSEGYLVQFVNAPDDKDNGTAAALDRLQADFVARSHGTEESHADVLAGTVPGREVRVNTAESSFRVRLFRTNKRTYQVLVIHRRSSGDESMDDRFLTSFRIQGS